MTPVSLLVNYFPPKQLHEFIALDFPLFNVFVDIEILILVCYAFPIDVLSVKCFDFEPRITAFLCESIERTSFSCLNRSEVTCTFDVLL